MSERVILLGFMSHFPVAGVAWQTLHYLLGLQRLGCDVWYVEAHGCSPTKLMSTEEDDGAALAASYIDGILRRHGLGDRWAYVQRYPEERRLGPAASRLDDLLREAAVILNLHGGHMPTPDLTASNRLVYLGTDPVEIEIEVHERRQETLDFLAAHCAHFTFGENLGHPDCKVPVPLPFRFRPTRQPVVMELWENRGAGPGTVFTTIGNWRQPWRTLKLDGKTYRWSKHLEFQKFIDLPRRTQQPLELALSSHTAEDQQMLEGRGWRVRSALDLSGDLDVYRRYIAESRGEFTVAKEQNVVLRSGWFSDRSATYLAAGRPVVTQETGFSSVLPVGEGLFAFETMEGAIDAIERINADYARHARAARELARACFAHDVVLGRLLEELGLRVALPRGRPRPALPPDLVIMPLSRWPTRLPEETVRAANALPVPSVLPERSDGPRISVVIATHDGLPFTKMCTTRLLGNGWRDGDELILVDNASTDGTREFLAALGQQNPFVRVLSLDRNAGFARANNLGLARAGADVLVLMNNDILVPRGWQDGLLRRLRDPTVGLVGPVTNRTCNEAQIDAPYRTGAELEVFARDLAQHRRDVSSELSMLAMFCVAMRRDVFERVGPLDEQFGIGMFEDDDYARRVRAAGLRIVCAEDLFVHHFGQATIGELCLTGEYESLLQANRARFEAKWGEPWKPHGRRITPEYRALRERMCAFATENLPEGSLALVVSKGDDALLHLPGRTAWHFPQGADGSYANEYPADSAQAVAHLEELRARGARFLILPKPAFWWLDHYAGFREHLEKTCSAPLRDPETCTIFELEQRHV